MITHFEALADPTRRRILDLLRERPRLVGELVDALGMSQPGVSKHLRVLREVGLVRARRDAQRRWYELRPEPLAEVDTWLASYRHLWEERLDRFARFIEQEQASMEQPVTITRTFDAPLAAVWKAWTNPDQVMRWWGPTNVTSPAARIDFRVGGKYNFCMHMPDGQDLWSGGTYLEIEPMKRIVFTDSFTDAEGSIVSASVHGITEDLPLEFKVVLTFEEHDGKTTMTLQHYGLGDGEMAEMTVIGWTQSFDKLAASLQ